MTRARELGALAAAALLVVIGGCFNPTFDNPTCGPGGECPSGTSCVQNICRAGGDDVDAPPSSDAIDGAIDAPIDAPTDGTPTDGTPNDGTPTDGATLCPTGDVQSPTDASRCFRKLPNQQPWMGARTSCQSLGVDLADIRNGQENQVVSTLAAGEGGQIGVWLGGHDTTIEMEWRWVNTNALIMGGFQGWAAGEPNAANGPADDCMRMDQTGQWFDTDCSAQTRKPICLTRPI